MRNFELINETLNTQNTKQSLFGYKIKTKVLKDWIKRSYSFQNKLIAGMKKKKETESPRTKRFIGKYIVQVLQVIGECCK